MWCDPSLDSQPRDWVNVGIKLKNTLKIWKIVKWRKVSPKHFGWLHKGVSIMEKELQYIITMGNSSWQKYNLKKIYIKRKERKRKELKLQCPLCIVEILTKASIQKCHLSHTHKHEDIWHEMGLNFQFHKHPSHWTLPYTKNWMKFYLLKRWEIKASNLQTIRTSRKNILKWDIDIWNYCSISINGLNLDPLRNGLHVYTCDSS